MKVDIRIVFLVLFAVDSINAVIATRLENRKYYAVCKSLLMPLLLTTYLCWIPREYLEKSYQKLMIIAYVCHSTGDILLLLPKSKTKLYFFIGTLAFFAGHIFNILWFAQPFWARSKAMTIISIVIVIIIQFLLTKQMVFQNRKLGFALSIYSLTLAVLTPFIVSTKSIPATLGLLFFWVSDYTIARRELGLKTTNNEVTISTYIVAQFLIVTGMYFLQK